MSAAALKTLGFLLFGMGVFGLFESLTHATSGRIDNTISKDQVFVLIGIAIVAILTTRKP